MPKVPTFPPLFDSVNVLSMSKLKEWGYLKDSSRKNSVVTWSKNGIKTSSVSMDFCLDKEEMILEYKYDGELRKIRYDLVCLPSNLGKGKVWFFVCPKTYNLCRKLYCIDGYFYCRRAFNGGMYESQIQSKKLRWLDSVYGDYFKLDNLYAELRKKHFKKYYAGKPTKRYRKICHQIARGERVDYREIEMMMSCGF